MQVTEDVDYESDVPAEEIQLGFLEAGANEALGSTNWTNWDGGKVGGKPIWLDPVHIPSPDELRCKNCDQPMTFLLQIYCPLDEPDSAFHRALYVFICNKASCVQNGSYKCLRVQLKKENDFYPTDASAEAPVRVGIPQLCEVCGCRGPLTCSKCHSARYCSRAHQKDHWASHKLSCGTENLSPAPDTTKSLFPEYTIVIEDEMLDDEVPQPSQTPLEDTADEAPDADFDAQLTVPSNDPAYIHFLSRVSRGGNDQVLRYVCHRRGCPPLQISSATGITPSACLHCGSPSILEFQIMPQILHYLQVDANTSIAVTTPEDGKNAPTSVFRNDSTKDIDWGTLDIYTCQSSCDAACEKYVEEYIWKQDLPLASTPSAAAQCSVMCTPEVPHK